MDREPWVSYHRAFSPPFVLFMQVRAPVMHTYILIEPSLLCFFHTDIGACCAHRRSTTPKLKLLGSWRPPRAGWHVTWPSSIALCQPWKFRFNLVEPFGPSFGTGTPGQGAWLWDSIPGHGSGRRARALGPAGHWVQDQGRAWAPGPSPRPLAQPRARVFRVL